MLYGKPERRRKSRPDHVDPDDAEYVLRRDGECVIAKLVRQGLIPTGHQCAGRLTIEHLLRFAGRRVHGRRHTVACCLSGNVDGAASKWRDELRDYVARVEPG